MLWKIVDTFNGYEGRGYQKRTDAETQLGQNMKEFFLNPGNRNARFCQVIVPAGVRWAWSEQQNKFLWQ